MNFRPPLQDTVGFRAQPPDPGALDFLYTSAQDALYHSPFAGTYRFSELSLEKIWGSGRMLSPEEANEQYGLDGDLQFNTQIYESAASLMMRRKLAERERMQIINDGISHGGIGRQALGIGTGFVASFLDPINFASAFVPIVGVSRNVERLRQAGASSLRIKLAQGLVDESAITSLVGKNIAAQRITTGAIEGAVGQALVEPLVLLPALQEQANYDLNNSLTNLGFGAIFGGTIHFAFGKLGDYWAQRSKQTQEAAALNTINDILNDNPAHSAGKLDAVDERSILDDLANTTTPERIIEPDPGQKLENTLRNNTLSEPATLRLSKSTEIPDGFTVLRTEGNDNILIKLEDFKQLNTQEISSNSQISRPARFEDVQKIVESDRAEVKGLDETVQRTGADKSVFANIPSPKNLLPWTLDINQNDIAKFLFYPEMRKRLQEQGFDGYIGFGETLDNPGGRAEVTAQIPFNSLRKKVKEQVETEQLTRGQNLAQEEFAKAREAGRSKSPQATKPLETPRAREAIDTDKHTPDLEAEEADIMSELGDLNKAEQAFLDAELKKIIDVDNKTEQAILKGVSCMINKSV